MLEFVKGNFFDFDADIRVNTVNCVGVMGAGVALAFKNKYPEMFKEYVRQCKANEILPGKPSVWKKEDMFSKGIEIINFPTKDHWRNPSEYEYIESGLIWLSEYLKNKEGLTITLPALGCGHGGLDWEKVKKLIIHYLAETKSNILVFEPESSKNAEIESFITSNKLADLENLGVSVIRKNEKSYPPGLIRYTEKDLWFFGRIITEFDISLISSTKPNEQEKKVVLKLIEHCKINRLSILFGGSSFDKKMALHSIRQGVETGIFLPSGISYSAEKNREKGATDNLSVLSIGDPFKSFDRKAYMPSVMGRMFICKSVIFTTERLKWLEKQRSKIISGGIKSYFMKYENLQEEDCFAAININAKPIKPFDGEQISEMNL
ncbi:macro domain-containing protein [Raoultella ornithinolytica]|uniref:macro domain-containing protein n=1 Tax=Raoultella ornithinolytica TaxID=54291 RepID=UPI002350ED06|nr:macro domain-containing protein [Raoultella ornithinolytica]MDC7944468.1 macro domain-containing protein [Raoultella ornithinolytica]HBR9899869.1 macro domain-containing protein [Klebsiella pneumoniae]